MAQCLVGTDVVDLGIRNSIRPIIQNLGPGDLYVNTDEPATLDNGIRLLPGEAMQFLTPSAQEAGIWVIATQTDTDVRIISVGGNWNGI